MDHTYTYTKIFSSNHHLHQTKAHPSHARHCNLNTGPRKVEHGTHTPLSPRGPLFSPALGRHTSYIARRTLEWGQQRARRRARQAHIWISGSINREHHQPSLYIPVPVPEWLTPQEVFICKRRRAMDYWWRCLDAGVDDLLIRMHTTHFFHLL